MDWLLPYAVFIEFGIAADASRKERTDLLLVITVKEETWGPYDITEHST